MFIEHTAGKFPVWLAPEQVRVITVNQEEVATVAADKILERQRTGFAPEHRQH